MSGKVSKTARASAGLQVKEKKVIPDEVYVKNLRNDLESGLYVAQEGARALLRTYDLLVNAHASMGAQLHDALEAVKDRDGQIIRAAGQIAALLIERDAALKNNSALNAELQAALAQIARLDEELGVAHAAIAQYRADVALETTVDEVIEETVEELRAANACGCGPTHAEGCVLARRSDG